MIVNGNYNLTHVVLKFHFCRVAASLVWVESLQLLQEDVAVADAVVRVGHDEELEDGPSAGTQEQDCPVSGWSGLCVHHNLVQLVPEKNIVSVMQTCC